MDLRVACLSVSVSASVSSVSVVVAYCLAIIRHARTQSLAHSCLQQRWIETSGIFVDPPSARAGPEQGWQVPGSADAQRQLGLQGLSPSFPAPPDGNSSKLCPQIVVRQYARVTTTGLVSGVYSLCERKPCATLWWPFGVPWRYGRSPTLVWPVRILQRQPQFCVAGISL